MKRFLLTACLLALFIAQSLFAREVPVDLFAALNPVAISDETKVAAEILKHFGRYRNSRNEGLQEILMSYLASNDSSLSESSRVLAAEVIVQISIQEKGKRGFLALTKNASTFLRARAAAHLVKLLNSHVRRPFGFQNLNINDKKKIFDLMIDQAGNIEDSSIVTAISKWASVSDLKLFVKSYQGSELSQNLAGRVLIHVIEKRNGPIALARFAIQDDLGSKISAAAIQRILEIIGSKKYPNNVFRLLANAEKEDLVCGILDSASSNSLAALDGKQKAIRALVNLNRSGDVEQILRSYETSTEGLRLAASALVLLKVEQLPKVRKDSALAELSRDKSPYVQKVAAAMIKSGQDFPLE